MSGSFLPDETASPMLLYERSRSSKFGNFEKTFLLMLEMALLLRWSSRSKLLLVNALVANLEILLLEKLTYHKSTAWTNIPPDNLVMRLLDTSRYSKCFQLEMTFFLMSFNMLLLALKDLMLTFFLKIPDEFKSVN